MARAARRLARRSRQRVPLAADDRAERAPASPRSRSCSRSMTCTSNGPTDSHLAPAVPWAERELVHRRPRRSVHIAIDRRAGELHRAFAARGDRGLARAHPRRPSSTRATGSRRGAVPSVTLKFDGDARPMPRRIDDQGALDRAITRSLAGRAPEGLGSQRDGADPRRLAAPRDARGGACSRSRAGSGIFPAELLLAELGGSSLTYQNVAEAAR